MKLTCARGELAQVLGRVSLVVERRNTIPILSNVLLRAEGDRLSLKATDLDIEVTGGCPARVEQAGATTVTANLLHDIVRKLPAGGDVVLEQQTGTLSVRAGRSRFSLLTLDAADYPDIAAGDFPARFRLAQRDLARIFAATSFAISTEETRYYLNGIYLHPKDDGEDGPELRAVATDGHRLARLTLLAPAGAEALEGVILPRKAVAELGKLIDAASEEVLTVEAGPTKMRFSIGPDDAPLVLTTKLIDGTFPDYQRVIPTGNDRVAALDRKPLMEALDRVAAISAERGRAVRCALEAGRLTLTVNNPDAGAAAEDLDAAYDGDPFEIGFNARYLLDILGTMSGPRVTLRLDNPGSPTILTEEEGAPALYVLMPMRV